MRRECPPRIETMERAMDRALSQERLMASLAAAFGVLALALAGVGLHGLLSYAVTGPSVRSPPRPRGGRARDARAPRRLS